MVGEEASAGMELLELEGLGDTDGTRGLITPSRHLQPESPCARMRIATGHRLGLCSRSLLSVELEPRKFACACDYTTHTSGRTQRSGRDATMPAQRQEYSRKKRKKLRRRGALHWSSAVMRTGNGVAQVQTSNVSGAPDHPQD
jgi:hypothetical protein